MSTQTGLRPSPLWFLVPGAFILRLGFMLITNRAIDSADSVHYIAMAQQFAAGDFWNFDENLPVLYPAWAALTHLVLRDWELAFQAISLIASTLSVIPIYWISRELHGERAARLMGALVMLWPWLIDYASRVQPEALSVCLWFTSIWLVYRAITSGGSAQWRAIAALFALHLTRPEGTLLMLAAPLGALLLLNKSEPSRRRRVAGLFVSVAAISALYALTMRALIGTATVSYRAPMSGDLADYFQRGAVELGQTFFEVTFNALPVMLGPFLLAFIGLGVFTRPSLPNRRLACLVLFFCAIQYAATLANFSPSPRYIMPVVVALGFWAAWGIECARTVIFSRNHPRLAHAPALAVIAVFIAGSLVNIAAERFARVPASPVEYRSAGIWMKENTEPGLILTRKPQIGYYANMPTTGPAAEDDIAALVQRGVAAGARYVAIDERYTAALVPGIAALLDPENAPPELVPVYQEGSPGVRVVVYELHAPGIKYLTPEEFPRPDSRMGPDERRRKFELSQE